MFGSEVSVPTFDENRGSTEQIIHHCLVFKLAVVGLLRVKHVMATDLQYRYVSAPRRTSLHAEMWNFRDVSVRRGYVLACRHCQPSNWGFAADIETALTKNDRPCTVTVCIDLRSRMHATWPTIMQSRLTYTQIQQSGLALPSSSPSVIIVVVVVVNFPQRPSEAFLRLSAVLIRRRRESRVVGTYGTRYFRLYRHTYYARKFCEYCSTPTYKH